jgi:hypothetical protein
MVSLCTLRLVARLYSVSFRREVSDKLVSDPSLPLFMARKPSDANGAACRRRQRPIAAILLVRDAAQVLKAIIEAITIDVVDVVWPFAERNRPDHAMGCDRPVINRTEAVAASAINCRERLFASVTSVPRFCIRVWAASIQEIGRRAHEPVELAARGLIAEEFPTGLGRDRDRVSHFEPPMFDWLERRAAATVAALALYHSFAALRTFRHAKVSL